jgi:hypothetical protein
MIAYQQNFGEDAPHDVEPYSTDTIYNGVAITTRIVPAENARNGGDWCEAWPLSATTVALSIGDVCGHG